ncbi:EAL domain-containing protein [Paucibacter sp. APW11]|uniref:EAL domain-containing protein n=1 Tax=Roseateles aquae TaxID=3077235 RepID=A0ABU3PCL9_9BURK|nr:EAL domain-containing protein [Paucibacter sp. APW11]MDT8999611.1 EAL domain-containing protein [Paucibacter sp. APW11]
MAWQDHLALIDALPHALWMSNAQGQLLAVSSRLLLDSQLPRQQLLQQGWAALIDDKDLPAFNDAWQHCLRTKTALSLDLRLRGHNAAARWQLCLAAPCHDAQGRLSHWLGSFTDISARKEAEQQLREADALWKLALESIGDGVWDWYVQTGVELFSERYLQMYGFDADEIENISRTFDERTHPDDIAQMELDRRAHFEGRSPLYVNEHRVRCKDGSWKWVLSRGMVISRDAEGRPLRMVGTHTDITERKAAEALIWKQAHFDALTGLPNRRMLRERLEQDLTLARAAGEQLAVLFIDLDHFKEVNDSLGHDRGDALLVQAAQRIRAALRPQDTVARMGGDEFTVLLPAVPDEQSLSDIVHALIKTLASPFELGEDRAFVSASIGISLFPRDGEQIETLFKHADQALYVAKAAGRNRYSVFTPALQAAAQLRMRLTNDLREALARQQFRLVFQPIVELRTGAIHKAEALLRWLHPEHGLISPADFVPLAESSGLIMEIDAWVFEQAVGLAQRWRKQHDANFQLSINRSPLQFRGESKHYEHWLLRLAANGLAGAGLAMEITEGLLLDSDGGAHQQLQALRAAGISISLDDFGTGYSSLAYLQRYEIDCLKIDQSFVRHLEVGSKDFAVCKAIITLAHELGLKVVAEGVETQAQHELLLQAGCDYGQGFWFARPMSAADIETLLRKRTSSSSDGDR